MTAFTLVVALLASQTDPAAAQPPPPPPPAEAPAAAPAPMPDASAPVSLDAAPESGAEGAPKPTRVHVTLRTEAKDAVLYDVTRLAALCRAPCGAWLDTDAEHPYQVRAAGFENSSTFTFGDLQGEVAVHFTPRVEPLFTTGKVLMIIGAVGVGGGAVAAVVWLIVVGIMNLIGATFSAFAGRSFSGEIGGFEVLYAAAIAAGAGAAFLTPGIIMMVKGRERLSVDVATGSATALRP